MSSSEHEVTGKEDVTLKGEMSKIQVIIPEWITTSK